MDRRKFMEAAAIVPLAARLPHQNDAALGFGQKAEKGAGGFGSLDPRIEVHLDRIGFNLDQVRAKAKVPVMAVVKANAYGHGLVEVSRYLEAKGVAGLMVGKLKEALDLRKSGVKALILNFGPFGKDDAESIVGSDICQNVYTEDARFLDEAAGRLGRKAAVDIHVDTGMNRVGVPFDRALPLVEKMASLPHLRISGISTTLTEDPEFDKDQLRRFLDVCRQAEKKGISVGKKHAASSAGLFQGQEFYLDMIRPGIALYGYYPNSRTRKEDSLGLRPALDLYGYVTFLNDISPGDSLSYLRAFKADKKMKVATIGVGYSDGYPTTVLERGIVSIGGKERRIIGAVTCNHFMVDLEDDATVKLGDEALLIGSRKGGNMTADLAAERAGISDYRLIIGLNPELERTYKKGKR